MEPIKVQSEGGLNVTLTIRLLMHGKEVGSIIGKKGETVKKMREDSGARINISEGNCPERIVTITGPTDAIFKAFAMIAYKFEEDIINSMSNSPATSKPPVTLRLVVPASQCGSLIGKGGSKIKEMREVAERSHDVPVSKHKHFRTLPSVYRRSGPGGGRHAPQLNREGGDHFRGAGGHHTMCQTDMCGDAGGLHHPRTVRHPTSRSSLDASNQASTHELTIPNDLIGCIIGRQGTKINEIRQMSGAQIKIANAMEGSSERQITITGTPANISLAQYLINARFRDVAAMWNDPSSMTTS
ncbi:poly(rC)-binding protein 4-like isoform X6 [Phyllopteryx taeniolatus]|uniref:poly(rC)-binding protein 4-like isoform X6 n=1 Tax=Phyllopteryx taeniolatus TaxID=161469 RepID=UPI002AD5A81C|nr:poly(rC)-binding protein 4-like isoform X6 [Phyllopteryx taeniolatus]